MIALTYDISGKNFPSSFTPMAATMAVTTMATKSKESWSLQLPELALPWTSRDGKNGIEFPRQALFASVSLNTPPAAHDARAARPADNCDVARQLAAAAKEKQQAGEAEEEEAPALEQRKKKGGGRRPQQLGALRKVVRVKIANPHLRRLVSGAVAGAVSRTFVAPLETIRTHLMVGSCGADTMAGVFQWIMRTEGWTGLFRGNAVNVLRVAPSKAIEARYLNCTSLLSEDLESVMVCLLFVCMHGTAAFHLRHCQEVPDPEGRRAAQGPHPDAAGRRRARRGRLHPVHLPHGADQDQDHHRGNDNNLKKRLPGTAAY